MNMVQIQKMLINVYRDYIGMGRRQSEMDKSVLSFLMQEYAQTCMDWEEIQWLWIQYLEKRYVGSSRGNKKSQIKNRKGGSGMCKVKVYH